MKIAAMILGIIGGLAGLAGAVFALFVGGVGDAFGAQDASTVIGLGFAAIPLSILGIVGGAMTLAKPKFSGIAMLISAVGGTIAISAGYLIAGPLLLIAGIMALVANRREQTGTVQDGVLEGQRNISGE
ncbi:DUF4064 domain-containing protein [Desulfolucanica intricata]|uniref:DUF4064 domain-containing protein n=1 Tax=Desulfolucanica intricata TaxID=1285191 RepID=UPI00082C7B09|nr:DUF4064 domain-containing protein [Desulfolucanica intricata]